MVYYVVMKLLIKNLFLWWHELANFLSILHLTFKGLFGFVSVQMYLDSSVSICFLWFRKDEVWLLYHSLELVASPSPGCDSCLVYNVVCLAFFFLSVVAFFHVNLHLGWHVIWGDFLIMWCNSWVLECICWRSCEGDVFFKTFVDKKNYVYTVYIYFFVQQVFTSAVHYQSEKKGNQQKFYLKYIGYACTILN